MLVEQTRACAGGDALEFLGIALGVNFIIRNTVLFLNAFNFFFFSFGTGA
jgi:hypothetical protein